MKTRTRFGYPTLDDAIEQIMSWAAEDLRSTHGLDRIGVHFIVHPEVEENGYEIVSLGLGDMESGRVLASILQLVRVLRPIAGICTEARRDARSTIEGIDLVVQYPDFKVREYRLDLGESDDARTSSFRLVRVGHIDEGLWFPLTLEGWERSVLKGVWSASLRDAL